MNSYRELLIGCGARREKDIRKFMTLESCHPSQSNMIVRLFNTWQNLTTLDNNPNHAPDIVCDLRYTPFAGVTLPNYYSTLRINEERAHRGEPPAAQCYLSPIALNDNLYDEIHAYEVLEHIGAQGDYKTFFAQFSEFHRILRSGGLFCATCPSWASMWAWGDPSHTRVITSGTLAFLSQAEYAKQVGKTAMSDFRHVYKADFEPLFIREDENTLAFVLRAVK